MEISNPYSWMLEAQRAQLRAKRWRQVAIVLGILALGLAATLANVLFMIWAA